MNTQEQSGNRLDEIFADHDRHNGELIPILQDIQEAFGYVTRDGMTATAQFLNIPESTVYGVVTFYSQFYLARQGKHKIRVCQGTACHVRGAGNIIRAVEDKLGIKVGESTDDFEFTIETVACFGSCALAPVVVVDDKVYGNVTPETVVEILENTQ